MKSYIACIQKLKDLVTQTNLKSSEAFIACSSLRVFEAEDFKFLNEVQLEAKDFLKNEDLSYQLNSVHPDTGYWDIDPNMNLFDLYKSAITDYKIKPKTLFEKSIEHDISLLYNPDDSETKLLSTYQEHLDTYNELVENYQSIVEEFNPELPDIQQKDLRQRLDVQSKTIALHFAKWELNSVKSKVEHALKQINQLNDYDLFLEELQMIKQALVQVEQTGLLSSSTYAKLQITPIDFYQDELAWSALEVNNSEFTPLFKKAKTNLKGFNESVLSFDYKEDYIEKITLNYCIISVKRQWLNKHILNQPYRVPQPNNPTYIYAQKVLLIKDLRVILKDNISDAQKKEIEASNIIKFGPLFMKNQFFLNKHSKQSFIKPITNKGLVKNNIIKQVNRKLHIPANATKSSPKPQANLKINKARSKFALNFLKNRKTSTTTINPKIAKPIASAKIAVKPDFQLFYKIDWKNAKNQSVIHFTVSDKLSKEGIYKTDISIQNQNTNFYKEIETDERGLIKVTLPKGRYDVFLRKNGYKELKFSRDVQVNKNQHVSKQLEPEEVVYDSYFLLGILGESITF